MTTSERAPIACRIYVASLSDYNAGRLHGRWIDATQDADDIWAEVQEMLKESPEPIAEEWAIHDYEGFGELRLSEYESFEAVSTYAKLMDQYGEASVSAWLSNRGGLTKEEYDGAEDLFSEDYAGEWSSVEEYAENYLDECGFFTHAPTRDSYTDRAYADQMGTLRNYFDFEKYANDLVMGGDIWVHEESYDTVHVFYNH